MLLKCFSQKKQSCEKSFILKNNLTNTHILIRYFALFTIFVALFAYDRPREMASVVASKTLAK